MPTKQIPIPVILLKEKVGKKDIFVATCPIVDIASQGKTEEEAFANIEDALKLYWKEPEAKKVISYQEIAIRMVNVSSKEAVNVKTPSVIRA